jgi:DNA-binding NarL/FixJ family response regulator
MKPIRVLLADDHALVRAGLRALIERLPGVEVTGEASNGREAVKQIHALRPDVVLMDIGMSELNGLEATARVTKECPGVRVIILSMHTSEEYVVRALRAGAAGYLVKGAGPAELEVAVQAVARGQTYLSPAVSKQVVSDYLRRVEGDAAAGPAESPHDLLTPRQREILQLVAEGRTTKEIAQRLGLSVKTVETHRAELMDRLDIHDIAGLVRFAVRTGLVSAER